MPQHSLIGAIALAAWLAMGPAASAQDMSKYPDWSGQWKKPDEIGNGQWDPTKPRGTGQQAPLTPEYKAIHEARIAERATGGLGGDPTAQCIPHGMPRMMIGVYPMELVVTPKATYMLSEYNEPRRIFTDGRALAQGDRGDLQRLLDRQVDRRRPARAASTCSRSRAAASRVRAPTRAAAFRCTRTTRASSRSASISTRPTRISMHIEVTTIDHALTRPWTVSRPYRREANPIWMSVDCSEDNHHVWVGKDSFFVSADGYLMPTKKDQAPPDLRYFKPKS